MAIELPKTLKGYAGILGKGFVVQLAPEIAKGFLVELLKAKKVDVKGATYWVLKDTTLWDILEPDQQANLKNLANRAGSLDWLTADWVIDAIKGDLPAVASLFLGWKKANNWLKRQVVIIKERVQE